MVFLFSKTLNLIYILNYFPEQTAQKTNFLKPTMKFLILKLQFSISNI